LSPNNAKDTNPNTRPTSDADDDIHVCLSSKRNGKYVQVVNMLRIYESVDRAVVIDADVNVGAGGALGDILGAHVGVAK
jgi:hypothetical protein